MVTFPQGGNQGKGRIMKKYLALLCASMLCVCCLALAACGGSASSSAASASASGSAASASTAASASSAAASSSAAATDPQQLFAGEWKLAGLQSQGVTMVGDLGAILGNGEVRFVLNADGSASVTMGEDTADATWKTTGDTTAEITVNDNAVPLSYEDGAILVTMENDGFNGTMILTKDGTYAKLTTIDAEGATAITSESALIGNWNLCGVNMMGVSMYGSAEDLAAVSGDSDMTLVIEQGGSAKIMGGDATWSVGSDGASISIDGVTIPVQALDNGNLIVDASGITGGMSVVLVYSK